MKNRTLIQIRIDPEVKIRVNIALAAAGLKFQNVGELFFRYLAEIDNLQPSYKIFFNAFLNEAKNSQSEISGVKSD